MLFKRGYLQLERYRYNALTQLLGISGCFSNNFSIILFVTPSSDTPSSLIIPRKLNVSSVLLSSRKVVMTTESVPSSVASPVAISSLVSIEATVL